MKKFTIFTLALVAAITLQVNAQITLAIKVYLEGPFSGTVMNTYLNAQNLIQLTQPYDVAPWNYIGTEQVISVPNPDIVDWVLVELRETTGDASTATQDKMINRQAAFIKADGSIVGTNGSSMIGYSGTISSNLYVIIWHRNHLAIMSSGSLTNTGGVYAWDFTDLLSKAHLDGQKLIGTNVFGMAGGDSDANGFVGQSDKYANWTPDAGDKGYKPGDLNLDAQVNNRDKDDVWEPNIGKTTRVPFIVSFVCGNEFIDSRDGQTYSSVLIGSQCWMAENLNIGTRIDGDGWQTDNAILEKYCYDDNEANCNTYGGLYQWNEMMAYSTTPGVQGICPAGWHVPEDAEWTTLTDFLGGELVAGGKMKATGTIEVGTGLWYAPNLGATNESGFTALPGGFRLYDGVFYDMGYYAYLWSSTEEDMDYAWYRRLNYYGNDVSTQDAPKDYGCSIRCVKDIPPTWSCGDELNDTRDGQTYSTVEIGDQCWMAENLNIGTMIPGTTEMTNNSIIEKYCYDNNTANCDTYGGLYQWNEMMAYSTTPGVQGICPAGWHVPADAEWTTLTDFLGGELVAGGKMKATGTIEAGTGLWYAPNLDATNECGFTAFPGGDRGIDGYFYGMGYYAIFWSSAEFDTYFAWGPGLLSNNAEVIPFNYDKTVGFSVRCIKDTPPTWSCGDELNDTRDGQTYSTEEIGDQCWMAENLNMGTMIQSTTVMTNNNIIEKYCFNNNETNCDTYGGLYPWSEMMHFTTQQGTQGICPEGWHVPTDGEMCTLTQFIDPNVNCNVNNWSGIDAGTKMKSTTGWTSGGNGTNTSGFTALPGGYCDDNGYFYYMGYFAFFWSSTEYDASSTWSRILNYDTAPVGRSDNDKTSGFSVRCLQD